jgi:uncharacterized protein
MDSNIPTRETCLALMEECDMLPQIRAHSLQVARVALTLGNHLLESYPALNMALVEAGALLHDIAKTECLKTKGNHVQVGADKLKGLGYEAIAFIVARHVHLEAVYYTEGLVDEAVLVHYADKRVLHETVVDLEARFQYLKETYGRTPEIVLRIEALYQDTLQLENRLFRQIPFSPQALKDRLS